MQPIIGITGRTKDIESIDLTMLWYAVTHTYTDSIRRAGGLPIMVVPIDGDEIDGVLDRIDGVLFTGGGDISPESYGAVAEKTIRGVLPSRDIFELALVHKAFARKIPVMAICRGLQIVNVAFGGTLIQDLPTHSDIHDHDIVGKRAYEPHLDLVIDEGCRLADIMGSEPQKVNSIHHQAVDELGTGLSVVARSSDGTIEAIEHEDSSWPLIAVQWHPEFLAVADHGPSNDLFAAFVESAAKYRADA